MPHAEPPSAWVHPVTLTGRFVRLEPLEPRHASDLALAATPETFRYFSWGPDRFDAAGLGEFIAFMRELKRTVAFAIIALDTGRAVGITSYLDIRDKHRGLEIGWTWIAADRRGTAINPEMKLLLLTHAFETLGAIRVCLKTDLRNERSQAAIAKLGAVREGVLRELIIMRDGHRRHTVFFSILESEWPGVKAGLTARLAAFAAG